MKQRILSLFLAAALVSGLLPATALAAEETPQSPQIIQTAEDLMALGGQELEGTYELAADIDMQDQPMEPIASLTGVLDGKGHTISNLCLTGQAGTMWGGSVQTGLVGTLNGTICNLKLEQLQVTTTENYNNLGTLAGSVQVGPSRIENCVVTGVVTDNKASKYPSANYVAGLVGSVSGLYDAPTELTVKNCTVDVDVTGSTKDYAAGLAGTIAMATVTVENCAVLGNVTADSSEGYAGGLIGQTGSSTHIELKNCYFAGAVSGNSRTICSVAYMTSSGDRAGSIVYENCYYDSQNTAKADPRSEYGNTGTTFTGEPEAKSTPELLALDWAGFVPNDDGYPVPEWTPATPPEPEPPAFSCVVTLQLPSGVVDATVALYAGATTDAEPIPAEADGTYLLTEPGEYTYTVTGLADYEDLTGHFTLQSGDTEKSIPIELVYRDAELSGAGTQQSPYVISTANELRTFAKYVNNGERAYADAYVKLANDIEVPGAWTPLGKNAAFPFRGCFDGGGHTVTVTVEDPALSYFGFFGCLEDATVENLTVNGEIYCSEPYAMAGGLAARTRGTVTLRSCVNNATVSALARGCAGVGGLVGSYDDNVEYRWQSIRLLIADSHNSGLIVLTGSDPNAYVGGLVGANENCVQLERSYNTGTIYAPGAWVGGLLGQAGAQTGDCTPLLQSCFSAAPLTGAASKTYGLYAKGTLSEKYLQDSYGLEQEGVLFHSGARPADLPTLSEHFQLELSIAPNFLLTESQKYCDVIAAPADAETGTALALLEDGQTANPAVRLQCSQGSRDIVSGCLKVEETAILLQSRNTTGKALEETATLRWTKDGASLRKPVTILLYPSASPDSDAPNAQQTLMHNIANTYVNRSGEWVIFDMAAYAALDCAQVKTSNTARENYLNLTVNALQSDSALVSDRAKAEIILNALEVDSSQLTPYGGETTYSNPEKLQQMDLGSGYYAAPWVLLAEQAGQVVLTEAQRSRMIALLISAQGENGLFYSIWGNEKYDDVDTTGTALAALARFSEENTGVQQFIDRALEGLSLAQGANGSYGNVNSDAMVITGLLALGIDPGTDTRFVKNGCSLRDALMLYANSAQDGFTTHYVSGTQGEKAQALATEQGFRALVALEHFSAQGQAAYNIYADAVPSSDSDAFESTGSGEVELPDGATHPGGTSNITVGLKVQPGQEGNWLETSITMPAGSTVAELLTKAFSETDMVCDGLQDGYIKSLTKAGVTLSQYDQGPNSGWMYQVNGSSPNVGIGDYTLKQADQVLLYYTADWTKEDSTQHWGGGSGKADSKTPDQLPFADVAADSYYYDAVLWATGQGVTTGTSDTTFDPDAVCTRAQIVTFLWRAAGSPAPQTSAQTFSDVAPDSYYAQAVRWAAEQGIICGTSENAFTPDATCTRAQGVTFLWRFSQSPAPVSAHTFSDVAQTDYYCDAVSWAAGQGITTGVSPDVFAPDSVCTRAQIVTFLYRALKP